jgi:hypothetical protein
LLMATSLLPEKVGFTLTAHTRIRACRPRRHILVVVCMHSLRLDSCGRQKSTADG